MCLSALWSTSAIIVTTAVSVAMATRWLVGGEVMSREILMRTNDIQLTQQPPPDVLDSQYTADISSHSTL